MKHGSKTKKTSMTMVLIASLASGCMMSPTNGQELSHKNAQVTFDGYFTAPNYPIMLYAYNYDTKDWVQFDTAKTGTSRKWRGEQADWYQFVLKRNLPQDAAYWRINDPNATSKRKLRIQVKAESGVELSTFDVDQDIMSCLQENSHKTDLNRIAACQSNNSPKANLLVSCGGPGETCCRSNGYYKNLCNDAAIFSTYYGCNGSCPNYIKNPGYECRGEICQHCGSTGEACCWESGAEPSGCGEGLSCSSGTCLKTASGGGSGGGSGTGGGSGGGSTPTVNPGPCNDDMETCCGTGTNQYCNENLQCQSGYCNRCSQVGDGCCYYSTVAAPGYCNNNLECKGNKCVQKTYSFNLGVPFG